MLTKVFMEALSPTMEEGRLVKWLKNEGDAVKSGDVLAEVETDKAIMELVARGDGILRRRLVAEGATTPVGTLIGVIAAENENIDALVAGAGTGPGMDSVPAPSPAPTTDAAPTATPGAAGGVAGATAAETGRAAGAPGAPAPATPPSGSTP